MKSALECFIAHRNIFNLGTKQDQGLCSASVLLLYDEEYFRFIYTERKQYESEVISGLVIRKSNLLFTSSSKKKKEKFRFHFRFRSV